MPFMPQVPIGSNLHVSAPAIDPVAKLEGCDGGKSLKCLLPLSCSPSPPKVSAQGVNCPIKICSLNAARATTGTSAEKPSSKGESSSARHSGGTESTSSSRSFASAATRTRKKIFASSGLEAEQPEETKAKPPDPPLYSLAEQAKRSRCLATVRQWAPARRATARRATAAFVISCPSASN